MGRGDKRTKKGKRTVASFGNSRKKTKKAPIVKPAAKAAPAAKKKTKK